MKFLVIIVRNMRRQARRTILTILTIAVATLVFAMLVSVPTSMDRIVDRVSKNQRLFVVNRAGPWNIPAKYCLDIKKLPHVTGCAADLDEFMLYRNDSDWIGMSAADVELLDLNRLSPDPLYLLTLELGPAHGALGELVHVDRAAVGLMATSRAAPVKRPSLACA